MNWNYPLIKLLLSFLVMTLLPTLCLAQKQSYDSSSQVVFEIVTESWGMTENNTCRRRLIFRLYASGRVEYETCLTKQTESGPEAYSLIRKETKVEGKKVADFIRLIEESDFLEDMRGHPYHSGYNGIDFGWDTALTYYKDGQVKKVVIKNYLQDSTSIPEWLHKIIKMAGDLKGEYTIAIYLPQWRCLTTHSTGARIARLLSTT